MADSAKPSLLKQLLGAVVGMTAALALYMAYKTAAPVVTAYILPPGVTDPSMIPQGVNTAAEMSDDSEKYQRIGARTREIAERLGAAAEESEAVAPAATIEEEHEVAALPPASPVAPVVAQTADDLQRNAQERREAREFTASLTAAPVPAKPAASAAPVAAAKKTESKKTVAAVQADAMHGGAPNLPSSGRGTDMLALVAAFAATAAMHRKTRMQLLTWARSVR